MIIKDKKINFSKQLSKYLQKHDLTGREFAAFVGIDEAQVSRWLNGQNISKRSIQRINEKLGDFIEEITGEVPYLEETLTNDEFPAYLSSAQLKGALPVYDIYASAGQTSLVETMEKQLITNYVSVPGYEDCLGWVRVKGDSMSPFLNSGDYIALKKIDIQMIFYGHVYFIEFGGEFAPEERINPVKRDRATKLWNKLIKEELDIDSNLYWIKHLGLNDRRSRGITPEALILQSGHATYQETLDSYISIDSPKIRKELKENGGEF